MAPGREQLAVSGNFPVQVMIFYMLVEIPAMGSSF
jgi:hypothetical protein